MLARLSATGREPGRKLSELARISSSGVSPQAVPKVHGSSGPEVRSLIPRSPFAVPVVVGVLSQGSTAARRSPITSHFAWRTNGEYAIFRPWTNLANKLPSPSSLPFSPHVNSPPHHTILPLTSPPFQTPSPTPAESSNRSSALLALGCKRETDCDFSLSVASVAGIVYFTQKEGYKSRRMRAQLLSLRSKFRTREFRKSKAFSDSPQFESRHSILQVPAAISFSPIPCLILCAVPRTPG